MQVIELFMVFFLAFAPLNKVIYLPIQMYDITSDAISAELAIVRIEVEVVPIYVTAVLSPETVQAGANVVNA